jgi:hypothetical protein
VVTLHQITRPRGEIGLPNLRHLDKDRTAGRSYLGPHVQIHRHRRRSRSGDRRQAR